MKLLFESLQTYATLLLALMPANYTPTRCVNPSLPVSIRVGISIQKPVDSHLDKTRAVALKIWSCTIFNEQEPIVKLRASTLQAEKQKLTASVTMGFILIAIPFEAMGCFYHFCPSHELRPSLTEEDIKRGTEKRELDELRRNLCRRKVSLSVKCGHVSGGDFKSQPLMLNRISEKTSLTDGHLQNTNS